MLLAEQVEDATNGLLSTLSSSLLCTTADPDCRVEAYPCERRTLETMRELASNALCWRGSRQADTVLAVPCPFYSWKRVFQTHPANCYRTICPGPCDSQPCQNGGTCIPEGVDRYHCLCPLAFGGEVNCGMYIPGSPKTDSVEAGKAWLYPPFVPCYLLSRKQLVKFQPTSFPRSPLFCPVMQPQVPCD